MIQADSKLAELESQDDKDLIRLYVSLKTHIDDAREAMLQVEYVLRQRMAKDGATAIPDEDFDVRLEFPPPLYDNGKLARLRELLPEDVIATAWIPEHNETIVVQEKWNATHFKAWVKFGKDIADIIEQAKIPASPKLRIKPKKVQL